ncbi:MULTISPECIES: histone-like nucleoid-structuring protein, MvaT/MvaU family [unclassified Pseudomonas]|uniref:histone-like nucleoid-structuring protein, MvaT/MvaU family n=1 Tax=unclassified Pseudomonas TaxID=196821 RepID=UPI000C87788C|nr:MULTISPECIES: histone-like nucleoid-structuring protein, MvaT/MvaU family [unclassified Pseudomonas]PMU08671.1 transcriptional regulator [Pseudomonas sp. FW305-20]PMU19449.1 transcriptional regulator [Pseudomonas sp. FW305-122]PMU38564.1 transcriptional regulator [Pseudomonas sp. FW305-47B]PMX59437.1 transcriptional regulator [Pseudomonas sp. FW305-33]PMX69443.1 transcriptional regulator [Pseudomonas sp. FW305-60]
MSKLAEFRQLEKHLAEQLQALEALKGDVGLKKEIEFETKLRALLAEYGYSLPNVINLLDPQSSRRASTVDSKVGTRKPRQVKVYKNPHTGEVVETKGGNHKTLKEWKAEHGSATVESWLTQ